MSLIDQLGENNENVAVILERYDRDLQHAKDHIAIEGKRLEKANLEQASWQAFYDERRIELYTLVKHFEAEVARVRGKLWAKYTDNFTIALGPKDKDQYINKEPAYLLMNAIFLEVKEIYSQYEAVVDAFRSRGFALRNITNIRVSQLEDVIL